MAPLNTLDPETLDQDSLALLERLSGVPWGTDFYLAGSAALALYLRHRPVRDLDLMSPVQRLRSIERRDHLQDLLQIDSGLEVETGRDGFLYVRSSAGPAIRFFYYPYPLIEPEERLGSAPVASPTDLGLMKLGAIISRGTLRDFVDLFLLTREIPLDRLLERAPEKFGHVRDFPLQALKGLADRSRIAGESMPRLVRPLSWSDIERWLDGDVSALARRQIGLD